MLKAPYYFSLFILIFLFPFIGKENHNLVSPVSKQAKYVLVIHGGAGNITKNNLHDSALYKAKLLEALQKGSDTLKNGATSLDAVVTVIKILEDSPLFNAGKGAVFKS